MARVLGLDTSLTATGIALIDTDQSYPIRGLTTVGSGLKKTASLADKSQRMNDIADRILIEAQNNAVDLIVVEGLSFGSKGQATRDLAGLWWTVTNMLADRGYPIAIRSPQQRAKYATGDGRADKQTVVAFVIEAYSDLLAGNNLIKDDNRADALVLAAMGARVLGHPIESVEPGQACLAAMEGMTW